jgi:hypothetical protein
MATHYIQQYIIKCEARFMKTFKSFLDNIFTLSLNNIFVIFLDVFIINMHLFI